MCASKRTCRCVPGTGEDRADQADYLHAKGTQARERLSMKLILVRTKLDFRTGKANVSNDVH